MNIAVTTANGHLGSAIIRQLIQDTVKDKIIGIARTPQKAEYLGIEVRKGDYNSQEEFEIALKGIDMLMLISSMGSVDQRAKQYRNIIEAAKNNGVKKIVYTSIIGDEKETEFAPIVRSNRKTEELIQDSGFEWVIGRNGIYIEPDLEYIDNYIKEGGISNSAGEGKCTYTSRKELGVAFSKMILNDNHNGNTYNLTGSPVSQYELADEINRAYNTRLEYKPISVESYSKARKEALGDFLGSIIGGIYDGIRRGDFDVDSDFYKVTGREHKSLREMITEFRKSNN